MRIRRPRIRNVTMHAHASDAQVADFIEMRLRRALSRERGGIAVAFPGGSTPAPILAELATRALPWSRINVYPTDDRDVDEDDPASNFGMLRDALEPAGALVTPLAEGFDVPHFALVWLGMGTDGHIASLFPSSDPQVDDPQPVRRIRPDPMPEDAPYERISLTIPALVASDEIVIVIRGIAKKTLFKEAIEGDNDLPVRRLLAERDAQIGKPLTCFT